MTAHKGKIKMIIIEKNRSANQYIECKLTSGCVKKGVDNKRNRDCMHARIIVHVLCLPHNSNR